MNGTWVELADGVLARRYTELDLTIGLVVGSAAIIRSTPVLPSPAPDVLDLGDRTVALRRPGRGHTDHDLVVDRHETRDSPS